MVLQGVPRATWTRAGAVTGSAGPASGSFSAPTEHTLLPGPTLAGAVSLEQAGSDLPGATVAAGMSSPRCQRGHVLPEQLKPPSQSYQCHLRRRCPLPAGLLAAVWGPHWETTLRGPLSASQRHRLPKICLWGTHLVVPREPHVVLGVDWRVGRVQDV